MGAFPSGPIILLNLEILSLASNPNVSFPATSWARIENSFLFPAAVQVAGYFYSTYVAAVSGMDGHSVCQDLLRGLERHRDPAAGSDPSATIDNPEPAVEHPAWEWLGGVVSVRVVDPQVYQKV